ncbi:MAG: hypothetical protein H7X80_11425 [bacterium]|nr:hypothetical protein [Candidatus Kapabacteria bacterium]
MTVFASSRIGIQSAFLTTIFLAAFVLSACTSSKSANRGDATESGANDALVTAERIRLPTPGRMVLEALEGPTDTIEFHIGSPLFLRLRIGDDVACPPGTGEFFYFDATTAQLGWSFVEVTDSLLFPSIPGRCERYLMLSSEASNRLAEGRFTMRAELFMSPTYRLSSDMVALRPVRAAGGADEESYARFLQEQIVGNAAHLRDPQTLAALFGEGVPTSAESEVYRGVVMFRSGDMVAAGDALRSADEIAMQRKRPLTIAAVYTRDALLRKLGQLAPNR